MKRVYTLYRVSTKKQVCDSENQNDIPLQYIECHKFCEAQENWSIEKEFYERGVSGYKVSAENRDKIQELRQAALNHEFDVLLVFMLDRIGRKQDETPFVVEWFVKQGIEVWSVKEGQQSFEHHVDSLINFIIFWQAEGESKKLSTRIGARMKQLVQEGRYTGRNIPFGYELVWKGEYNKKGQRIHDLTIKEDEANIVRMLFSKTVEEGLGTYRLACYLNDLGIKTHRDGEFNARSVKTILSNELYRGYFVSKNARSEKRIEDLQIVDDTLFEAVQNVIRQRSKEYADKRDIPLNTKGHTFLSGNIFCAHCGKRLTVIQHMDKRTRMDGTVSISKQLRYSCYHKSRKLTECDGQSSYSSIKVDRAVLEIAEDLFARFRPIPIEVLIQSHYEAQLVSNRKERKQLSEEIQSLLRQVDKLELEIPLALVGESKFSEEQISSALQQVKDKLSQKTTQLRNLDLGIGEQEAEKKKMLYNYTQFENWASEFKKSTLEEKKMILASLLKVYVGRGYKISIVVNAEYRLFFGDEIQLDNVVDVA